METAVSPMETSPVAANPAAASPVAASAAAAGPVEYEARGVRVRLLPDSNKARKLKYNLVAAREQGADTLLTFGGAYSNHIRAVAAAGAEHGFATIGVIRGEEHLPLNESLTVATGHGMRLAYLDRTTYREKHSAAVVARLRERFGDFYLLPEGGSNEAAVRGCAELPGELGTGFDVICCAVGTGGTLAGIAAGLAPRAARPRLRGVEGRFPRWRGGGPAAADVRHSLRQLACRGRLPLRRLCEDES